jgi:aspartate aminotransferase
MNKHKDHILDVHLNPNVSGLKPSATVAINDLSNELKRKGKEIFKMGLGQSPFPVPECVVEALRENAHQKDYLPVKGLRELQEAVAEHHRRNFGIDADPDDVLIGPGSKELMFVLQLTYFGDLVIPAPSWVSYAPQAKIIGRHIQFLPTQFENDWHLTPEDLEERCTMDPGRPRLLILNYPLNPTGTTMSKDRLEKLAEVADRYRVVLLSDEIYGKIHHDGEHQSIVPFYPEGTIFSGGLSKWCGAGGWRLGVFVFPRPLRWLLKAMAAVGTETFTSTSAPIQYAAVRAFQEGPEIDTYLEKSRRVLKALGNAAARRLDEAGARIRYPQGGFYLFPDFSAFRGKLEARGIKTSADMSRRLLEDTGVAFLPGSDFGRSPEELTARLAYVDFNGREALEAVGSIPKYQPLDENFIKTHFGKVIEAIDRINEWMTR